MSWTHNVRYAVLLCVTSRIAFYTSYINTPFYKYMLFTGRTMLINCDNYSIINAIYNMNNTGSKSLLSLSVGKYSITSDL